MHNPKWDMRYLKLAYEVAQWSKDPSRKIGAVTVGAKGQVLSQGFNGFPRGLKDDFTRLHDRDVTKDEVIHAEMNAIYNATYNGTSLDGATLYVYGLPICSECAKGVIQVGIKRVVMPNQNVDGKWLDSWMTSMNFFDEAGVNFDFIDFDPRAESRE